MHEQDGDTQELRFREAAAAPTTAAPTTTTTPTTDQFQEKLINLGISFLLLSVTFWYCCGRRTKLLNNTNNTNNHGSHNRTGTSHSNQSATSRVISIRNMNEFETRLSAAQNKLVVVDFYAQWCGPCKRIAPEIDALSVREPGVVFLKVDVDEAPSIANRYEITGNVDFICGDF